MYEHRITKRVRYGETDRMGYLYYGRYAEYYEIGRVEALRNLGIAYRWVEDELGVILPVVSLQARYLRPARYDDEVEIVTQLRRLPERQMTFHHELYGSDGQLLNGGRVTLAFAARTGGSASVGCPPELLTVLRPHF